MKQGSSSSYNTGPYASTGYSSGKPYQPMKKMQPYSTSSYGQNTYGGGQSYNTGSSYGSEYNTYVRHFMNSLIN